MIYRQVRFPHPSTPYSLSGKRAQQGVGGWAGVGRG